LDAGRNYHAISQTSETVSAVIETGDAAASGVIGKEGPTDEFDSTKLPEIKLGVIGAVGGVGVGVMTKTPLNEFDKMPPATNWTVADPDNKPTPVIVPESVVVTVAVPSSVEGDDKTPVREKPTPMIPLIWPLPSSVAESAKSTLDVPVKSPRPVIIPVGANDTGAPPVSCPLPDKVPVGVNATGDAPDKAPLPPSVALGVNVTIAVPVAWPLPVIVAVGVNITAAVAVSWPRPVRVPAPANETVHVPVSDAAEAVFV
jgi:hypothetical protein